jgi:hypothetical protein
MNHNDQHPVLHAHQQCDVDTFLAVTRQVDRLNALIGQCRNDADTREALQIVESLYEQSKGGFCNCRVEPWYRATRRLLGAPVAWQPVG